MTTYYAKQSQFSKSQVNVNLYNTMAYENKSDWTLGENKPNSKPIQSQSKPIKPNLPDAQMSVNSILTKDYERNDIFAFPENKAKTKPIKANFQIGRQTTEDYFGVRSCPKNAYDANGSFLTKVLQLS